MFVWMSRTQAVIVSVVFSAGMVAAQQDPLFTEKCSVCHGAEAKGGDRGPALANNRRLGARSVEDIQAIIKNGTPGGMPAFPLPGSQIRQLASYVHSLNATALELMPEGDVAAGERFFFGQGKCASCHAANGRGNRTNGPDLSNVGRQMTLAELETALSDPSARIADGYGVANVTLNSGSVLKGFARSRSIHDVLLQTFDGKLHSLNEAEYRQVKLEPGSLMPALQASADEKRDLIAWLSRLGGEAKEVSGGNVGGAEDFTSILHPKRGDWPTYYGNLSGNRYTTVDQITPANVAKLQMQWMYPIQYSPLETTPLVVDGVMYVTGPNQVFAIDGRTGDELWRYVRPRTPPGTVSADAALGANRGVALSGDRVFFTTDDAHMLCLNRLTRRAAVGCLHAGDSATLRNHFGAAGGERSGDLRA